MRAVSPLIVIVGPTASGKTSLAIEMARLCNGEIVCADSRTIYRHMDIGTAKPTEQEMTLVPHWGIDIVNPGESFSASDFKSYATEKIDEIRSRGRIPFLVGGTGLYVDAVVLDYQFGSPSDPVLREKLDKMTIGELHEYCSTNNISLPENKLNKRYVIRSIELNGTQTSRRTNPADNTIVVGISTDKEILRNRIRIRVEQIINKGVVEETKYIGDRYGWGNDVLKGNIYPVVKEYLNGSIDIDKLIERAAYLDWQLAKRQLTWFKRNDFIKWFNLVDAKQYLTEQLAKYKST